MTERERPSAGDEAEAWQERQASGGPSDAERQGLGDIGELGDEAARGAVGEEEELGEGEEVEALGAGGGIGSTTPLVDDVERGRAAPERGGR